MEVLQCELCTDRWRSLSTELQVVKIYRVMLQEPVQITVLNLIDSGASFLELILQIYVFTRDIQFANNL